MNQSLRLPRSRIYLSGSQQSWRYAGLARKLQSSSSRSNLIVLSAESGMAEDTDCATTGARVTSNTTAASMKKNRIKVFAQHHFGFSAIEWISAMYPPGNCTTAEVR